MGDELHPATIMVGDEEVPLTPAVWKELRQELEFLGYKEERTG
jgi:hypothetical protein